MIYIAITSYFLPIEIIIYLFPVETIRHELGFLVIHVLDTSLVILLLMHLQLHSPRTIYSSLSLFQNYRKYGILLNLIHINS